MIAVAQDPHGRAARREGGWLIRVAQDVHEIEGAVAEQSFGIDDNPAAWAGIEDILMMDVAMQHDDLLLMVQKLASNAPPLGDNATLVLSL